MRPFSLLVKPASGDCNLRCRYCFYLETCHLYLETNTHRISDSVLERVIRSYMETDQPVYSLCWQGGEPTHPQVLERKARFPSPEIPEPDDRLGKRVEG